MKILHIEDQPVDTAIAAHLLGREGIPVEIERVETMPAFREALERGGYALILSDYSVPGMEPLKILEGARKRRPDVPFIFLSGVLGEDLAIESLKLGATDYVLKHNMARLVPAVRRALREAEEQAQRKRAEEALRRSEASFRSLFDHSPDAIFLTIPDGRITAANPAACAMFRMTEAEILQAGRIGLVDPNDPRHALALEERARTGRIHTELNYVRKKGERFTAEVSSVVLGGEPLQSFVILRDITERKRYEDSLRRSQARLTQALRVARLGIFEHDHLSDVIEFSFELREMCGFGPHETVTLPAILERVPPQLREEVAAAVQRAHDPAGNGLFETENPFHVPGRQTRWMSVRSQTFFEGEGPHRRPVRTIGAVLDITDQKEHAAALGSLVRERTAKLTEAHAELESFSYSLVHDMRAPLRAMLAYAGILEMDAAPQLDPEHRDLLRKISISARRMTNSSPTPLTTAKSFVRTCPSAPSTWAFFSAAWLKPIPTSIRRRPTSPSNSATSPFTATKPPSPRSSLTSWAMPSNSSHPAFTRASTLGPKPGQPRLIGFLFGSKTTASASPRTRTGKSSGCSNASIASKNTLALALVWPSSRSPSTASAARSVWTPSPAKAAAFASSSRSGNLLWPSRKRCALMITRHDLQPETRRPKGGHNFEPPADPLERVWKFAR